MNLVTGKLAIVRERKGGTESKKLQQVQCLTASEPEIPCSQLHMCLYIVIIIMCPVPKPLSKHYTLRKVVPTLSEPHAAIMV